MSDTTTSQQVHGDLAMVHLRVEDADRAIAFFGALFDWEAERVLFDEHVSHYTINTALTIRILDDPDSPPMVPNYAVDDVPALVAAVNAAGGRVTRIRTSARRRRMGPRRRRPRPPVAGVSPRASPRPRRADAPRDRRGGLGVHPRRRRGRRSPSTATVLGWNFTRAHPGSFYFDTVERVGVFDEAAAFGSAVEPSATLYFSVDVFAPVLARIEELGGTAGDPAQDMGPYFTRGVHRRPGHDLWRDVRRARVIATSVGRTARCGRLRRRGARLDRADRRSLRSACRGSGCRPCCSVLYRVGRSSPSTPPAAPAPRHP